MYMYMYVQFLFLSSGLSMALGIGFLFGTQFLAVEFMRLCEDDTHSCNGKILTSFLIHVHV